MASWDERSLRRAFVHMQDAGQRRAFFVKFTGEGEPYNNLESFFLKEKFVVVVFAILRVILSLNSGVDDQGGPYRAVFETAVGEETTGRNRFFFFIRFDHSLFLCMYVYMYVCICVSYIG